MHHERETPINTWSNKVQQSLATHRKINHIPIQVIQKKVKPKYLYSENNSMIDITDQIKKRSETKQTIAQQNYRQQDDINSA